MSVQRSNDNYIYRISWCTLRDSIISFITVRSLLFIHELNIHLHGGINLVSHHTLNGMASIILKWWMEYSKFVELKIVYDWNHQLSWGTTTWYMHRETCSTEEAINTWLNGHWHSNEAGTCTQDWKERLLHELFIELQRTEYKSWITKCSAL